jgi:hypothetical protein
MQNVFRPLDLAAVFARNKEMFGDFRMEVEAGDGSDDGSQDAGSTGGATDKGFPADTPVAEMTAEQQVAYWKSASRKHEGRAKAFDGLTPDELADLRDKASKHDALEHELMSDRDRAVADAKKAAESELSSKFLPKLVAAEFRAAAAGKVAADKLAAALEFADMGKFVKAGEVDAEKVAKFVESLAPAAPSLPKGPSSAGMGPRAQPGGAPGDQGKAQAAKRFGTKVS